MTTQQSDANEQDDEDPQRKFSSPNRRRILVTIGPIILGLLTWITTTSFSFYLDTLIDGLVLFACAMSMLWLVERVYVARQTNSWPRSLWVAGVMSAASALLLFEAAQPPIKGLGTVVCNFGNVGFGYGKGPVWIKAATTRDEDYNLRVE